MIELQAENLINIRSEFPILRQEIHGRPLVYLDSAATTQKPKAVIDTITRYYSHNNASVHRGVYTLSERATQEYENTRQLIKTFINAQNNHEIIFTRGTTESINLVAQCFGQKFIKAGDEIVISAMEHHSNIVPWQVLCEQTGAVLKIIPVLDNGNLDLTRCTELFNKRTKLLALIHVSNVLGTINPIKQLIAQAKSYQIPVLIDAAQSIAHLPIDVQNLNCDFLTFSSHKMYGPTGTGVLYAKTEWLEQMSPYQYGGHMIRRVSFAKTEFAGLPDKFEAGTPNIVGVIGMGEAIRFIQRIGFNAIIQHEQEFTDYARLQLQKVPGLQILGNTPNKIGVISFTMQQAHAHDIATILDNYAIAVRAGHHCAMPLMERFKVLATTRISFGIYNQLEDIDRLIQGLERVIELFGEH